MKTPFKIAGTILIVLAGVLPAAGCKDRLIKDPAGFEQENPHYRRRTAAWLATPEAAKFDSRVTALSNALQSDPDRCVRATAARALGEIGDPAAAGALTEALDSGDDLITANAVASLGKLHVAEAGDKTAPMSVEHENASVRQACVRTMGIFKREKDLPYMIGALYDPDSRVRFAAMDSLDAVTAVSIGYKIFEWRAWGRARLEAEAKASEKEPGR